MKPTRCDPTRCCPMNQGIWADWLSHSATPLAARPRCAANTPEVTSERLPPAPDMGAGPIGLLGHHGFCGTPRHGSGMLGCGGSGITWTVVWRG